MTHPASKLHAQVADSYKRFLARRGQKPKKFKMVKLINKPVDRIP